MRFRKKLVTTTALVTVMAALWWAAFMSLIRVGVDAVSVIPTQQEVELTAPTTVELARDLNAVHEEVSAVYRGFARLTRQELDGVQGALDDLGKRIATLEERLDTQQVRVMVKEIDGREVELATGRVVGFVDARSGFRWRLSLKSDRWTRPCECPRGTVVRAYEEREVSVGWSEGGPIEHEHVLSDLFVPR